jgi:hypothetical protein
LYCLPDLVRFEKTKGAEVGEHAAIILYKQCDIDCTSAVRNVAKAKLVREYRLACTWLSGYQVQAAFEESAS